MNRISDPDQRCINTIRLLCVDMVEKAKSGHPGMPMGMASAAYVLWTKFLRHNPVDPSWPNRDRFILSAGHGSTLIYALLHLTGYDLSMEELQRFRQWNSKTPGHPEYGHTPGVEATTGPLGQGFGMAVGMAVAEAHLAACFNMPGLNLVDHRTYVIAGDGDLMEGLSSEAASLAGHLHLGKLIVLFDSNQVSLAGATSLCFTEDVGRRFEAYGWHVQHLGDGNNLSSIEGALQNAQTEKERPSLIIIRTTIGYGASRTNREPSKHTEALSDRKRLARPKRISAGRSRLISLSLGTSWLTFEKPLMRVKTGRPNGKRPLKLTGKNIRNAQMNSIGCSRKNYLPNGTPSSRLFPLLQRGSQHAKHRKSSCNPWQKGCPNSSEGRRILIHLRSHGSRALEISNGPARCLMTLKAPLGRNGISKAAISISACGNMPWVLS